MANNDSKLDVYLEVGKRRVFAGAVDWPGWCRSGRDESSALQALLDYGPRYDRVLHKTSLNFEISNHLETFKIVERLEGSTTTDFGAPGVMPSPDQRPIAESDLNKFEVVLRAIWRAYDQALSAAFGKELKKGPRGGGRDLDKIFDHVLEADRGYLSRLGWKAPKTQGFTNEAVLSFIRDAMLKGISSSARGEIPSIGPRGGIRWTPRYFVRRVAWHVLDHAWEIEDRILES